MKKFVKEKFSSENKFVRKVCDEFIFRQTSQTFKLLVAKKLSEKKFGEQKVIREKSLSSWKFLVSEKVLRVRKYYLINVRKSSAANIFDTETLQTFLDKYGRSRVFETSRGKLLVQLQTNWQNFFHATRRRWKKFSWLKSFREDRSLWDETKSSANFSDFSDFSNFLLAKVVREEI